MYTPSNPDAGGYDESKDDLISIKTHILNYIEGSYIETEIPILINNDELPQISWGHAKYAHYFNEKGFNFFKFKHADHLPRLSKNK